MERFLYLKNSEYFRGFDDATLKELSENGKFIRLKPKEFLFNEGFEGDSFYLLVKGNLRVFKTSPDGKESTIKIISAGEMFGEAVLFGKSHYPASAVATIESEVFTLRKESFWKMLDNPESRDRFILDIFGKLRYLTDQVHYLTSFDLEERFFRFLRNNYGEKEKYTIPIAKRDCASAIGTIPETFSRLIRRLTRRGILHWEGRTVTLRKGFWSNEFEE